jgi:hypothetical protein
MKFALSCPSRLFVGCVFWLLSCGGTVQIGGDERRGTGGAAGDVGIAGAGGGRHPTGSAGGVSVGGGKGGGGGLTGTAGATSAQKPCPAPFTRCGSECIDINTDVNHCGNCFGSCGGPGTACLGGTCQKTSTGPGSCRSFETFCSNLGLCVDLQSNPFTCGSCFSPCANGEQCLAGLCQVGTCVGGSPCKSPDGSTHCPNFSNDAQNCGGCNVVCPDGVYCQNGKCVQPECAASTFCGASGCVDTFSDVTNCGGCGKTCTGGAVFDYTALTCLNSTCGCAPTANPCGKGCASDFWYCPPPGFQGSALDLCAASARNSYERCACKGCLAEVQACSGSPTCVNAMDCSLRNVCIGCQPTFNSCMDVVKGNTTDPLADKLVACLNSQCTTP